LALTLARSVIAEYIAEIAMGLCCGMAEFELIE
jgi:hypothetical protein